MSIELTGCPIETRRTDLAGRLYAIETRDAADTLLQRHGNRHDKAGHQFEYQFDHFIASGVGS